MNKRLSQALSTLFIPNQRRGLSEVITTLIIILLALVAIGAVWFVISNLLSSGSQQIGLEQLSIDINFLKASINGNDISLTVKRTSGAGNVTGVKFIISDDSNSEEFIKPGSLSELQEKTFVVTLLSLSPSNVKTASVVPIFNRNGKDIVGDITDTYTFTEGSAGEDYGIGELSHSECVGQTCILVDGYGINTCVNSSQCISGDDEDCIEERTDTKVCYDEEAECGYVQDSCGSIINCDVAAEGCYYLGEICNNGLCVLETCTETRTDTQVCNDKLAECGMVKDKCGNFVDCNAAIGGCTDVGDICNNGICIAPGCVETRTDTQVCNDKLAECGMVKDVCGDFVNCNDAIGGCISDLEQCVLNSCQPLTPVSGTVSSAWPIGIGIYFDSSDLPIDNIYSGYYAKFLPPSQESQCLLVESYRLPQPPQTSVIVKLQAIKTNIAANDAVQLWQTFAACSAY